MASLGHAILLALGVIAVAKCLWGVIAPDSMRRFAERFLRWAAQISTLLGLVYALIGLALFGVILMHQPIAYWFLGTLGIAMLFAAAVFFRFSEYESLLKRLVVHKHSATTRIICAVGLLVAILMIWVALRDPWL